MNVRMFRAVTYCSAILGTVSGLSGVPAEPLQPLSTETQTLVLALELERPVTIEAFISPTVPKSYAQSRADLVAALRGLGGLGIKNIRVLIHDTELRSAAATRAEQRYGITSRQITTATQEGTRSDNLFMGVAVTCGLESVTLPFVEHGVPAEYELVRSLYSASQQKRKRVGVLVTDAPLLGGFNVQTRTKTPNWPIIDELEKQYDVVRVDPSKPITEAYDVLLAVQPSTLGPEEMNNFVAAVGGGQPTAIFEDPAPLLCSVSASSMPRQAPGGMQGMMMGMRAPQKGEIKPLWDLLGVDFPDAKVVWQDFNPYPKISDFTKNKEFVFADAASGAKEPFNLADPISSGLQQVLFPFPGFVAKRYTSDLTFTPLVETGKRTGTLRVADLMQMSPLGPRGINPDRVLASTGLSYVLAAHIQGKVTLPPLIKEPFENEEGNNGAKKRAPKKPIESTINVVLTTDVDMLSQAFVVLREQGDRPEIGVHFRFDNVTFVLNILDELAGDQRFLAIRRQRGTHPVVNRGPEQVGQLDRLVSKDPGRTTSEVIPALPVQPDTAEGVRGLPLCPQVGALQAAARFELAEYDRDSKIAQYLHLALAGSRWVICSHDNYSVGPQDRMASALSGLLGLTVLDTASERLADHELHGVLDPEAATIPDGTSGVGTRVTIRDAAGRTLVALIVGKPVRDRPELRYVRRAGQIPVYAVKVNADKLSARVADWIDPDLLQLSPEDIQSIQLHDYSISIEPQGAQLNLRARITLEHQAHGSPAWRPIERQIHENGKWVSKPVGADEELDTARLNEMMTAIAELKIVGVDRKPSGLAEELKAGRTPAPQNHEGIQSLAVRGFYLAELQGKAELFSREGEVHAVMKDGVRYVLRFGEPATVPLGRSATTVHGTDKARMNRCLFVTTKFDADAVSKPRPDNVPEQEAYRERVSQGSQRSKEINDRLAEWYYLVPDEAFKKVRPGHDKIVRLKKAQ
jgi:hypothetical protein